MSSPSPSVSPAAALLAAMAELPPTPTVAELAAALGWSPLEQVEVVAALETESLVETWLDPASTPRITLSARGAERLGVVLAPSGEKWDLEPLHRRPPRWGRRKPGRREIG